MPSAGDNAMSEKDWQAKVVEYASLKGWMYYHSYSSVHSTRGFPDLVLVRERRLVFAELKRQNGKPTGVQHQWLDALDRVADDHRPQIQVHIWRPGDWETVTEVLD